MRSNISQSLTFGRSPFFQREHAPGSELSFRNDFMRSPWGYQKDIAARIRAKRADYLLGLKANHGRAFEAVREHFERTCFGRGSGGRPVFDAFDEGHGRLVRRRVFASSAARELEPLRD
jgi:hypothetical protein